MDPVSMGILTGITTASASGGSGILGSIGSALSGVAGFLGSGLGSSALSMIGNFGGGLLSYGTDKDLMEEQYEYNLRLQKQAQQWQEYAYKNYHGWNVESLRNAGLNPILSATNGSAISQHSSAGSVGLPSSKFKGINIGEILSLMKFSQEMKNLETSTSAMRSQVGLNEGNTAVSMATAKKINEEANAIARENAYYSSDVGQQVYDQQKRKEAALSQGQIIGGALNELSRNKEKVHKDIVDFLVPDDNSASTPIQAEDLEKARNKLKKQLKKKKNRQRDLDYVMQMPFNYGIH